MEIPTGIETEYKAPKDHGALKKMVEEHLDLTRSNAEKCKRDRDYFDGNQLSGAVLETLKKRKQPPIYTNKIASAASGMMGVLDAAATDPEAFPRNVGSRDAADVVTKVLRYLADKADFKKVKKQCSDNFIIEGACAALLQFEGECVTLERIRWEDFIYDPLSREHDFEDAKWLGIAKLMDRSDVVAWFGDSFTDAGAETKDDFFDFNDDKAKTQFWESKSRSLIRVVDIYYKLGKDWHRAVFTSSEMLFAGRSPYEDDLGGSICPIIGTSWEVSRGGDRYGALRHMIPLQDEQNARRSKMLQFTNSTQIQITDRQATAQHKSIAQEQAAKADGVIPFGYAPIQAPDMAQGQMLLLQQTAADLDRMAPTPAILGRISGSNESGRARQILQQAGYTELARAYGRLEAWELKIYRGKWYIARQHLSAPLMIRITDDPRTVDFLQVNEPVMGPVLQPVIDPATGEPIIDPMTGAPATMVAIGVVEQRNRLAQLDMDIVLTTTPDVATLEHEVFNTLLEYAGSAGLSPFSPEFGAMLEISPLPNKRQTIERIQAAMAASQSQQPDPMAEANNMISMERAKADIEARKAEAAKDMAHAKALDAKAFNTAFATLRNNGSGLPR